MLKALGLSKKSSKEDLIKNCKEQAIERQKWQTHVTKLKAISTELKTNYQRSKGGFAVNRYEELKKMIKEAVRLYKEYMEQMKNEAVRGRTASTTDTSSQGGGKMGLASRLKMHAQGFATHQDDFLALEKTFAEMSTKQLEADLEKTHKDVVELKQQFYSERDRLNKLSQDYESSKSSNPSQRYTLLKNMVKEETKHIP